MYWGWVCEKGFVWTTLEVSFLYKYFWKIFTIAAEQKFEEHLPMAASVKCFNGQSILVFF